MCLGLTQGESQSLENFREGCVQAEEAQVRRPAQCDPSAASGEYGAGGVFSAQKTAAAVFLLPQLFP